MGLIQAALSATTSTLSDQWKEYFYCEAIPNNIIAVRGKKKVKGASSNRGDDNIISDGSVISVADGQCMVIVDNGQVVEICAEPGEFKYDSSTEPSIFTGSLGEGLKNIFAQIGKRITFGGQAASDQRVYYFNTKELPGVKYGTPSPVPFRVIDKNIGLDMDISVKCFGEYSIKVTDPISFYTNVCGNFSSAYALADIESQLKSELLTALGPAFAKLSASGVRYSEVPAHTVELADNLNEQLSKKWKELRGIEICSFGISSIKADEEDEKLIKQAQKDNMYANMYTDPNRGASAMVNAAAHAVQDAANNSAGSGVGFMNVNMANNATGINAANLYQTAQSAAPAAGTWTCPKCGASNTGKFCPNCGTPSPVGAKWYCPECGTENSGKFCSNCGTKKPE